MVVATELVVGDHDLRLVALHQGRQTAPSSPRSARCRTRADDPCTPTRPCPSPGSRASRATSTPRMSHALSSSARRIAATAASSWADVARLDAPGSVAELTVGAGDDDRPDALVGVHRQHAAGARRLVVRMRVHGHQREGSSPCLQPARCVDRGVRTVRDGCRSPGPPAWHLRGPRLRQEAGVRWLRSDRSPPRAASALSTWRSIVVPPDASWRSAWPPTSSPMPSSPASTSAAWRTSALRTRCLGGRKTAGRRAPVRRGHLPGRGRRPWPPSARVLAQSGVAQVLFHLLRAHRDFLLIETPAVGKSSRVARLPSATVCPGESSTWLPGTK